MAGLCTRRTIDYVESPHRFDEASAMNKVTARWTMAVPLGLVAVLLAGVAAPRIAWASDIDCHAHGGGAPVVCNDPNGTGLRCALDVDGPRSSAARHHLICDSAGMSERYERIYAEQQRMLHKGTIQNSDIANWRTRRDACDSARCLDALFHLFWRDRSSMHIAPVPAPAPRAAVDTSSPTRREPAPTPPSAPTLAATLAPTPVPAVVASAPLASAPLASSALPATPAASAPAAPVASPVPTQQAQTRAASAPATRTDASRAGFTPLAAASFKTTGTVASPVDAAPTATEDPQDTGEPVASSDSGRASLALESVLSGFAVLGTGAGFLLYRRRSYARYQARPAIPAAMVIAYALLLANALLLPFTLGLK